MRKMFSKKQLEELIAVVVESKDWDIDGDVSIGGDLVVTGSINGEENPSVKPIYCHPITLTNSYSTTLRGRINALIFNNSSEPFTKTTLIALLKSASNFRLVLTGAIYDMVNSKCIIVAHAYYSDNIYFMGIDTNGNIIGTNDNYNFENFVLNSDTGIADNINLIN